MSYAATSSAYREMEVLSSSPAQLVVTVYDFLLVQLRRTRFAIDTRNHELCCTSIARSQDAITELVGGLDMERGGQIAKNLQSLYLYFITELIAIGRKSDVTRLACMAAQVSDLRDAFAQISVRQTASAA
jgi:flagellar protein FliS